MSAVFSYAVGNGDMFSIQHNADSFTIIDCSLSQDDQKWILDILEKQSKEKSLSRFISTHPDQDHLKGLVFLDENMPICNFYCVENKATKDDETADFKQYCKLRDGDKAFYLYKGCERKWLNVSDEERGGAGLRVLWPDTTNTDFREELKSVEKGESPNNISPIIKYNVADGGSFLWMGDLETDFMEKIQSNVNWEKVEILFAPHHGRESGRIPESILSIIDPSIVIIGEAPSKHLNYYGEYNTITQNSAGTILFECEVGYIDIYVSNENYSVDFLKHNGSTNENYLGTLEI